MQKHYPLLVICLFVLLLPDLLVGQSTNATITGQVADPSKAVLPQAKVTAINNNTNVRYEGRTNQSGAYVVTAVPPGDYRIEVEKTGFRTIIKPDIILHVQDTIELNFEMAVGSASETVTVEGGAPMVNTEDGSVSTVVNRQFVENMPLNGRSFQALMTLTPGVVLTKTTATEQGQFSVNGQRADANYLTIDGVSANIGTPVVFFTGQQRSGSLPGLSASGGFNNLVSVDALQEFRIQTSSYAPEFGRSPGGQIAIGTRSGSNQYHGSGFDYLRNDVLDANDWFANHLGLAKPQERQNDFGGVIGGPIIRDHAFFFFSYEGLRLRQPATATADVPSLTARTNAVAFMKPLLNAYPLPTGTANPLNGYAPESASFSNPVSLDATSLRIDDRLSQKLTVFGRYNYSPSQVAARGASFPLSVLSTTAFVTQTLTAGATYLLSSRASNDFRFNYSRNDGVNRLDIDDFGGAVPITADAIVPPPFTQLSATFFINLSGARLPQLGAGKNTRNVQKQLNFVDGFSLVRGGHQLKFGIDARRSAPVSDLKAYSLSLTYSNANVAAAGGSASGNTTASVSPVVLIYHNFSAYGEDTWNLWRRLSLTYGLRWDVNPPPSSGTSLALPVLTGITTPSAIAIAPAGSSLYHTRYNGFGPRFGVAYQLTQSPGSQTVLRAGFGVFYDTGNQPTGGIPNGFPYLASRTLTGVTSLNASVLAPPALPAVFPASITYAFDPDLKLPKTYQWNVQVERSLGQQQLLSTTYVGAIGRDLLRQLVIFRPNSNFTTVNTILNSATSDYHAMQLQFQRRFSRGLEILASYSWSHSIDSASTDSTQTLQQAANPNVDRGSSDFDLRHVASAAVHCNIPTVGNSPILRTLFGNWSIDTLLSLRTSPAVDITLIRPLAGSFFGVRPDRVAGVPLYIDDSKQPGGRIFNPAALVESPVAGQGTLGRNAFRGFALKQVDFAAGRSFRLATDRLRLQAKAEIFNLFNHPNFAPPLATFGTDLGTGLVPQNGFGISSQMFGRSLGSGGQSGGFSPLYQVGGPRSIQVSLKLVF